MFFGVIQSLALHYEWFQDMFERMPKDGRETQWRTLGEHGTPEVFPLPEKMDETYHPLQRLLVLRAFRPDRVQQCSVAFVSSVLGKRSELLFVSNKFFNLFLQILQICQ